ncbi:MAG: PorV/PorQ family protein [Rhodothermales bacterium]|nr:PorV/PorQ family protein [Rhodothermales bacterium]
MLVVIVLTALPAEAQRKAGRNGAAFLKVGVGARATAVGSAATSFQGDANQAFWNPAGTALSSDQQFDVSLSYNKWIADLDHYSFAAGYNLKNMGTVTLSITSFGITDIPANRENGYTDPILQGLVTDGETSATFDFMDLAVGLSYSKYIIENLSLGVTAKVINESIDSESASAFAFDFGSVYNIGVYNWTVSSRISNLGSRLTYYNQDNPLPLTYSVGTSFYPYSTEEARVMVSVDATKPQDAQQLIFGGVEVALYDILYIRGGYKLNYSSTDDGGTSSRDAINTTVEKFSVGAGVQYDVSDINVGVDYAFTGMDLFDNVHQITLRFGR